MKLFSASITIATIVVLASSAFAQSNRPRPGLPSIFTTGEERQQSSNCPDVERGAQQAGFDDTYGCWSPVSRSLPGDGSWLDIRLKPAFALVYVNGRYAGTAQQFAAPFRALPIGAGPQRIEFRAPGYQPLSFWLRQDRETVGTLTGSLTRK